MRAIQEESIRVEDIYFGEIYSVSEGRFYGYTATEGEENRLLGFDFGFETIADARNACEAAILRAALSVWVQPYILEVGDAE